jgi:Uma2 family endonuclease
MTQAILTKPKPKTNEPEIIWEKLPEDFILPDDPVESIAQPLLAAALTESLDLANYITPKMLIASNMGIVAKVNQKTTVKAPDWFFVSEVNPLDENIIRRSYTPHTEGKIPELVMEFLSETETGEYSSRPFFPYGKMWFYEQILKVPLYVIFEPEMGHLEIRQLNSLGQYELQKLDQNGRYFLESMNLYLGVWQGTRLQQNYYWLRWWDKEGNLLLWGTEKIELERQIAVQERQRADLAEQEILRLRKLLNSDQ